MMDGLEFEFETTRRDLKNSSFWGGGGGKCNALCAVLILEYIVTAV